MRNIHELIHELIYEYFSTKNREEYRRKTIDKHPYLYNDNLSRRYSKKNRYDREIDNFNKKFSAYVYNRALQVDLFKRLGRSNVNDFFFLRNQIAKRINDIHKEKYFSNHYFDYDNVSNYVKENFQDVVEKATSFYTDITKLDIFSTFQNSSQKEAFLDNITLLSMTTFSSHIENRFYTVENLLSEFYTVEKKMKLEKIYTSPTSWTAISILQKNQDYLDALDIAMNTNTFSEFTYDYKSNVISESLEEYRRLDWYVEGLRDAYIDAVERGGLAISIAGELVSGSVTQVAIKVLSQSLIFASSLVPQRRLLNLSAKALYEAGNFVGKSFIANFAFQVNVEWAIDGYVQQILEPYVSKLLGADVFEDERRAKLRNILKEYSYLLDCEISKRHCDVVEKLNISKENLIERLKEISDVSDVSKYVFLLEMLRYKKYSRKMFFEVFRNRMKDAISLVEKIDKILPIEFEEISSTERFLEIAKSYSVDTRIHEMLSNFDVRNLVNQSYQKYSENRIDDHRAEIENLSIQLSPTQYYLLSKKGTVLSGYYLGGSADYAVPDLLDYLNILATKNRINIITSRSVGNADFCEEYQQFVGNIQQTKNEVYLFNDEYEYYSEYRRYPKIFTKLFKMLLYHRHYIIDVDFQNCFIILKFSSKTIKKIDINELLNRSWYCSTSATFRKENENKRRKSASVYSNNTCDSRLGYTSSYTETNTNYISVYFSKYKYVSMFSYEYDSKHILVWISRYMYKSENISQKRYEYASSESISISDVVQENHNTLKNEYISKNKSKYIYLNERVSFLIDREKKEVVRDSIDKILSTTLSEYIETKQNDQITVLKDISENSILPEKFLEDEFMI